MLSRLRLSSGARAGAASSSSTSAAASLYTLPKEIDTNRVRHTFPVRTSPASAAAAAQQDPTLHANRVRRGKPAKPTLLPKHMPSSQEELTQLGHSVRAERQAHPTRFSKEEYDRMEKIVQRHLEWEVVSPATSAAVAAVEEEEEEDLTALAKLERHFTSMAERRQAGGRRWDDLADITRDELREFKRLQLKLRKLQTRAQELNLDCNWLGLSTTTTTTSSDSTDGQVLEKLLADLERDADFKDNSKLVEQALEQAQLARRQQSQFPYQDASSFGGDSFAREQRHAAQSLAQRQARLTTQSRLVPKQGESEEPWSLANDNDDKEKIFALQQSVDAFALEFSAFQRELQFKRREPVCDLFWLERVSHQGFAQLNDMYDAYVFGSEPGKDAKEEHLLLDMLRSLERVRLTRFHGRARRSDLLADHISIGQASTGAAGLNDALGKYLTIGQWLFDREVPRSFEKYEWSPKMLRLQSLDLDDYEEDDQAEAAAQIEQFLEERERALLTNRWTLKYDDKPLVQHHNRQLMLRQPGLQLCHELDIAAHTHTGVCKLLVGARGVGKSATLLHTVAWARENGWITLVLPRAAQLVTSRGAFESGTEEYGINVSAPDSSIDPTWFGQPQGAEEVLARLKLTHLAELSQMEQKRDYAHKLYDAPRAGKKTLAHILMRGLQNSSKAPDALYDLRMELNQQTQFPVLIAIDEFDALYWPTAVWYNNAPVPAHKLTVCKTFRFVDSVPGDVEDDANPRTVRRAKLNPEHLPKRGGIIAACTRSLEAEPHESQIAPCRFDMFEIEGVDKVEIPKYTAQEVERAVLWYKERNLYDEDEVTDGLLGKVRALTGGFADKVAIYSQNRTIDYPRHI